jgi:6-phosphogluconolactonase
MADKSKVKVFEDIETLSKAACERIIELCSKAIEEHGRFSIALSGGKTPEYLFNLLAQPEFSKQIDWLKVFVFWGDERYVPFDDKRNNSFIAKSLLLDKVEIPVMNIFRMPVNLPPVEAAMAYQNKIDEFFEQQAPRFDLILLGIGQDGHTASLFPGVPELHEKKRLVAEVHLAEQQMFRITMTAPLINQAANIIFLVSGKGKAPALKAVLEGPEDIDKYPAQLIKPVSGNLLWLVDAAAASEIILR